jgi:hypothetical protein
VKAVKYKHRQQVVAYKYWEAFMKMPNKFQNTYLSAAVAVAVALASAPGGAVAKEGNGDAAGIQRVQFGCQMLGPYPTMGRANEVAGMARAYGYNGLAYHNGDGYYVKVC